MKKRPMPLARHLSDPQAFIDHHMPSGLFTEEYLRLRWEWIWTNGADKDLMHRLSAAYSATEACRIHHPERYRGPLPARPLFNSKTKYRKLKTGPEGRISHDY